MIILFYILNFVFASEFNNKYQNIQLGMANKVIEYKGTLFCASGNGYYGGLYYFENNQWKIYNDDILLHNLIRDLDIVNDRLFITSDKGIYSIGNNYQIRDENTNLNPKIYEENTFRAIDLVQSDKYIALNIDANSIYISDKNTIFWTSISIPKGYIYDIDMFQNMLLISIDDVGLIQYNIETQSFENILNTKDPIYEINTNRNDFLLATTSYKNYYSNNGKDWEDFNEKFNLNSKMIKKCQVNSQQIVVVDNSFIYFSNDFGKTWKQQSLELKLANLYTLMDLYVNGIEQYLSFQNYGILKLTNFNIENDFPNIFNYGAKSIINSEYLLYTISTFSYNYLYLYSKELEIMKKILTINGDEIVSQSIFDNDIVALSKFNGAIYSRNLGSLWTDLKLPSDYFSENSKVQVFNGLIFLFNSNYQNTSKMTRDFGQNWEIIPELSDEKIVAILNVDDTLYICTKTNLYKKVAENNINLMLSLGDTLQSVKFDGNLILKFENGKIAKFENHELYFFKNFEGKVAKIIDSKIVLFKDMTIRELNNESSSILYKFEALEEKDITYIHKLNDNNYQIGTNYLGIFELEIEPTSVNSDLNNNDFQYKNGEFASNSQFNINIFTIEGKQISKAENINIFTIKNLEPQLLIVNIQIMNKIYCYKIINN